MRKSDQKRKVNINIPKTSKQYDLSVIAKTFMRKNLALHILSVIRQKGKFQNGCFKKTKNGKFSEKQTYLTP